MSQQSQHQIPHEVLAAPIAFGPLRLANRLLIAPHTVNFGFVAGSPDEDYFAYITRRAPGFGLTWIPMACPDPLGRAEPSQPWLWDDRFIPGLARLAEALRKAGTEPGLQICHAGRQTSPTLLEGQTPVAPSPVPPPSVYKTVPRPLSLGEIGGIIEAYAATARRGVSAGFRALNLHFAHSYLVHQFLSAASNLREDEYGGELDARLRFAVEIVQAVRAEVGSQIAIDVRLNGTDFTDDGLRLEDSIAIAKAVLAAGADTINVSGGVYGSSPFNLLLPFEGREFLPAAAAIRAATGATVTGVGRIRTAAEAADAIVGGSCDMVGVGRSVMADPDWALKALGLMRRPVRPCLGTLDGCSERLRHFEPATCQVMPEVGRELRPVPSCEPRRIAIVGAGPAGAEAAVYAAALGDHVLLADAAQLVGGSLRLAAMAPGGAPFGELADFYAAECGRLGVDVHLGRRADAEMLAAFGADDVIIATGARPSLPGLRFSEAAPLVTDEEVLSGEATPSGEVVVIGAGRRAIATALTCAEGGARTVTIVDHDGTRLAHDASALMRRAYKQQLAARQIDTVAEPVREIGDASVLLARAELPADMVVLALRLTPVREVANLLADGLVRHVIGDAKEPRSVMDAIVEARDCVDSIHRSRAAR